MLRKIAVMFAAVLFVGAVASAPASAKDVSGKTRDFLKKAAITNMFEIQEGQLALERADRQDVKDFAQRLIKDHTQAGQELQNTLQQANIDVDLPQELDQDHKDKLDDLVEADAGDFTGKFIDMNVKGHQQAISDFRDYVDNGDEQAVQQFAAKTLPTLQEHERMAQQLSRTASAS